MPAVSKSLRNAVAPAYLVLCLLLGGSSQGIWVNMVLQLLAIAIIAWSALAPNRQPLSSGGKQLMLVVAIALTVALIQLVPLPPSIWAAMPGRAFVAEGYQILGQPLPWLPLTVTPADSLTTILRLTPALALMLAVVRLDAYRPSWLAWGLIIGTTAGVLLGALQVTSGDGSTSPWYLYSRTNYGIATGFFANGNHMATLLITTIPFLFAILIEARGDRRGKTTERQSAIYIVTAGLLLVVVLGLALNGSLAGLGLGVPVVIASAILMVDPKRQPRLLVVPAILLVVAAGLILSLPLSGKLDTVGASGSVESRRVVALTSWEAVKDFAPIGSGLGSFENVYRLYEDPTNVERTYVNHAHNDYLELAIETGVPGMLTVLLFLLWWAVMAARRWRSGSNDVFAKAATIASVAILAHSLVDFPLRTAAISGLFAMCIALLVTSKAKSGGADRPELWRSRHVEVR